MSSWVGKLLSGGVSELIGAAGSVIDLVHTSEEEKADAKLKIERAITDRMAVIESSIHARLKMVQGIIESEMQSGDSYTKRARPTVVYFGLLVIALNHVILPWGAYFFPPTEGATMPQISLPEEFWWAWSGVVGLWVVGRSAEKSGLANKATRAVTGSKPGSPLSFLD